MEVAVRRGGSAVATVVAAVVMALGGGAARAAEEATGAETAGGRATRRPANEAVLDRPARYDNLLSAVSWGGYYELEYDDPQHSVGAGEDGIEGFDQHRFVLFAGVRPHERIRMFSEIEFEHGGDADDLKLEQAWVEFGLVPRFDLNLRAGIDLIPVGRLNLNHDGNLRDFVFRPQVDERLVPTTWYEAGVWLNGALWDDRLGYQVGVSNGLRESSSGLGGVNEIRNMRRTTGLSKDDNNDNKAVSGRLAWRPWLGAEVGLSGYTATYASRTRDVSTAHDDEIRFLAVDGHAVRGPWEVKGEYVRVRKDPEPGNAQSLSGASGGYVELAYHFFPEFMRDWFFAQGFDDPTFTALARAEFLDFENPDEDRNDRNVYSFGLNYRPMERMAFKLTYDVEDRDDPAAFAVNRWGAGVVLGF